MSNYMSSSTAPRLLLLSGFLGAGKTTLMLAAAARLRSAGMRLGIITNDQGGDLVDTRLAEKLGFDTAEIAGGCFCCRFSDFIGAARRFSTPGAPPPDVILSEPVGSCTDLVATIIRPIEREFHSQFRLAPLTVVIDPRRAAELLAPDADPNLAYLFRKQLAEADIAVFTRADLGLPLPRLPGLTPRSISPITGHGLDEWLNDVMSGSETRRTGDLDIDYGRYAEAEAALGWVNWSGDLRAKVSSSPVRVAEQFLSALDKRLTLARANIAHLKIFLEWKAGYLKASICSNGELLPLLGNLDASPERDYRLVVNLRAVAPPEALVDAVSLSVMEIGDVIRTLHSEAFRPSPPTPEYRIAVSGTSSSGYAGSGA